MTSCVDIIHNDSNTVTVTNYYYETIEVTLTNEVINEIFVTNDVINEIFVTNDVINEIIITNAVTNTVINEVIITNYVDVAGWVSDFEKFNTLGNEYLPNGIMTKHNLSDNLLENVKFAFIQRRGEMFKFEKKAEISKDKHKYLYWYLTERKEMSNLALSQ